jgi:predicted HAD superfamily hydrolase
MIKLASFDVFDTLVCRLVADPSDVFKLIEAEQGENGLHNFARLRVEAESAARSRKDQEDVTIYDIYRELQTLASNQEFDTERLIEAEIQAEIRLCVPRLDVVSKLEEFRAVGTRCVAISDMYLPESAVERILLKCGIEMDAIYVSSEVLLTKATGNLYDFVRVSEAVRFSEWKHHGDNFHSDVSSAIAKGIAAAHTPIGTFRLTSTEGPQGDITSSIVTGTVRSLMYGQFQADVAARTWYQVGAEHTGIQALLLAIKARAKADEVDAGKINFLARDGYILKKVYDAVFKDDAPASVYLAASRRMINFIQTTSDNSNLAFLLSDCEGLTGVELLQRIGIVGRLDDVSRLSRIIHSKEDAVAILADYNREILEQAAYERKHVMDYLAYHGVLSDDPSVIVDVGWFCSIQKSLSAMLVKAGLKGTLHGVYFGTNVPKSNDFDAEGLFYTNGLPQRRGASIKEHIEVMELLFTAPEQSIVSVVKTDDGFRFIRVDSAEETTRIKAADEICKGALGFVDLIVEAGLISHVVGDAAVESTLSRFDHFVRYPGREISASIRAIKHSVGYGGSRYEPFLKDCGSIKRPLVFLHRYLTSYWPEALSQNFTRQQRLIISRPVVFATSIMWRAKAATPRWFRRLLKQAVRSVCAERQ